MYFLRSGEELDPEPLCKKTLAARRGVETSSILCIPFPDILFDLTIYKSGASL